MDALTPIQAFQLAVLATIGTFTAVFGWLHAKRTGVAAAEKAARDAYEATVNAQREHLSVAMGNVRLLQETIEADRRSDALREQRLEECEEERERERVLYERSIEQFEWVQAAAWSEDAEPPDAPSVAGS